MFSRQYYLTKKSDLRFILKCEEVDGDLLFLKKIIDEKSNDGANYKDLLSLNLKPSILTLQYMDSR